MDAPNELNYSPKPPAARQARRRILRIIAALLIIAVALFWITIGSSALRSVYYLHQCLVFQQPPTHLVWEINHGAIIHQEVCLPKHAILDTPREAGAGVIFLHELRQPDGTRRLVSLVIDHSNPIDPNGNFHVDYQSWEPLIYPKAMQWSQITLNTAPATRYSHWKFFAAQPDPADPTHFTFTYEVDATPHTCDAWLKNDGNLVISQRIEWQF